MTERPSSFQYQQVNLEISFHTSLIVLIICNSASYFIIEDLELLAFIQVWTWRITLAIYILHMYITIAKHMYVCIYLCLYRSIWLQVKTVFPKSWICFFFNLSILSNLVIAVHSLSFVSPLTVTVHSLH